MDLPKTFIIRCPRCRWGRTSDGTADDLKGLTEVRKCSHCGRPREFRCLKCGGNAKMMKIKYNGEQQ